MQAMARIESNVMDYSQFSGVTPACRCPLTPSDAMASV